MNCPYCNGKSYVNNSRSHNKRQSVWRRRQCKTCKALWTTDEQYDLTTTHLVKAHDSRPLAPFLRDDLYISILESLSHRKTRTADATAVTSTIISKVLARQSADIPVSALKDIAHETLQTFDTTAGAVYRDRYNIS